MKLIPGNGGDGKKKVIASKGLLTRKNSDGNDEGPSSTGFRVGRIEGSPGFNGVVGSRMVKISETRRKGPVEVETIAAPSVETMTEVKPSFFEVVVATLTDEGSVFNSIGTVNGIKKLVSERKEIGTTTVEDDTKNLTSKGSGDGRF